MTFYHFTHAGHLPRILRSGFLKTVESNVSFSREHAGPDVVWLLDQAEPDWFEEAELGHGLYAAKRQIRIEVDVPAIRWLDWGPTATMEQLDKAVLISGGGGIEAARHWYVFPAPIRMRRWVKITDTFSGETLYDLATV